MPNKKVIIPNTEVKIMLADSVMDEGFNLTYDFKDKFIRADVIYWEDLINTGSLAVAREKGLLRTEGKEYIVQDGDMMNFRFNV